MAILQTELNILLPNGNGSGFRDPAFAENKTQPVHRWVPWIAGFSTWFVEDCLQNFLNQRKVNSETCILDPFAGVGTTLVSSLLRGYQTIGFEINPYAALACRVKLSAPDIDLKRLEGYCDLYQTATSHASSRVATRSPLNFRTKIPFFSPAIEKQVFAFLDFVSSIRESAIVDVFRLAFGAVMVKFSNYTYEPSLGTRPGAGKPLIHEADVAGIIMSKLREMISDIRWMKQEMESFPNRPKSHVHNMSFMDSAIVLPAQSVDLMVTSPPYMNNYHYIRNTRPQMFWLHLVSNNYDLKKMEEQNVGKYWQTVRDSAPISLEFSHVGLEKVVRQLRKTRRDQGVYGGSGWANYVCSYFNDSMHFLVSLKRALKRRGVGVVVIGNSIIQGYEIKTEAILGDIAEVIGLKLEAIHCIRNKRVGASITQSAVRRGDRNNATLYESVVVVRKK